MLAFSARPKAQTIVTLALLWTSCALTACGSSVGLAADDNGSDAVAQKGGQGKGKTSLPGDGGSSITATLTPTVQTLAAYDTSIGSGVDSNGYAILDLRTGARRFFVNSAVGSDANGCAGSQKAATPLRSITSAVNCIQAGAGDQVLVAEGTSYTEGMPNLGAKAGYNAVYPTVIQSYDPADALNEGKYGRATNGRRPVINTAGNDQLVTCCTTNPASYLAIRGFDINPGNKPDMSFKMIGSSNLPINYILIENNVFRYTQLILSSQNAVHHIVRKNSFYGEWSPTAHQQGIFSAGTDGLTVEDNVFWHVGWKIGVSRDTDPSLGGPTMFRHALYQQIDDNALIRRNLFMDSSATGCSCRGDTSIQENVFIDNPIAISAGLGDHYDTNRPNGVSIDVGYNAILGDADINSSTPRGGGIQTGNGKQGSAIHNNLIARSRNPSSGAAAFINIANLSQPSYANFRDNVEYQWSTPDYVIWSDPGQYPTMILSIFDRNYWSKPASGTNLNIANWTAPNPMTSAQLFVALGCNDKLTCAAQMVETPEAGWAVKARNLLWQGYGMK